MNKQEKLKLESIFKKFHFHDYKWIKTKNIVFAKWVRMKCMFGCENYGSASCPPNVGSLEEGKSFIKDYSNSVIFHFEKKAVKDDYIDDWLRMTCLQLYELEKAVFLANYYKVFLLNMARCRICKDCSRERYDCKSVESARPTPEAFGIDCYATARDSGYSINVLTANDKKMDRFAFLLIE